MSKLTVLAGIIAILATFYQFYVKPITVVFGVGRTIEPIGTRSCDAVPLPACEKIVLHQPSGVLYLACSSIENRLNWLPATSRLNAAGMTENDYVATFDPATSKTTRLDNTFPLSTHGMDVVPSATNPSELFIYLVNHRKPLEQDQAHVVGANSTIEVFKTSVGSGAMTHLHTIFEPSVIITPNDVVGAPDGKSVHFTNDNMARTGLKRYLGVLGRAQTSVGYCHVVTGCKFAAKNLHGSNGITRAANGTFYVGNSVYGGISMLEHQTDNTLVVTETVKTPYPIDNLSLDEDGVLWAAGMPESGKLILQHFENPKIPVSSAAIRVSINRGLNAFYGEKYKIDVPFLDDGSLVSGSTSVAYDARRGRIFFHGICSSQLVFCKGKL